MSISFELFPTKKQHISVESIAKIWRQIMDQEGIIFQLLDVTRQIPSIEEIIQGEEVIKIFATSRPETIYYLSFFKIDRELDDLETFLGYNYTNLDEVTLTKRLNLFLSIGYSIDLEISSVNEMSANEKQQIILLIAELSSHLNAIVHFRNAFATVNSGLHYWNELLLD